MKRAKAADAYRHLAEKKQSWPTSFEELSFSGIPTLGTGTVPIVSPVSVLCGFCGAGKSTILRLVWAALAPAEAIKGTFLERKLSEGSGHVILTSGTAKQSIQVTFGPLSSVGLPDREVVLVDGARVLNDSAKHFGLQVDVEAVLNGTAGRDTTDRELERIKFILSRDYSSVVFYEVEFSGETVPFFVVTYKGLTYDSRTMGAGELSSLYLWWVFQRAENGSIILIEEPESFVSSSSQVSMIEHIVETAFYRKLLVLMTSHSPSVILSLPPDSVRYLVRGGEGVKFEPFPHPLIRKKIGISPDREVVIFVEDEVAKYFAQAWLRHHQPTVLGLVDIRIDAGTGDIFQKMKVLPTDLKSVGFLALLDGDAQSEVPKDLKATVSFLPGTDAPEAVVRKVANANGSTLATISANSNIPDLLVALEGKDIHDWLIDLAASMGQSKEMLVDILFRLWRKQKGNAQISTKLFKDFTKKLDKLFSYYK